MPLRKKFNARKSEREISRLRVGPAPFAYKRPKLMSWLLKRGQPAAQQLHPLRDAFHWQRFLRGAAFLRLNVSLRARWRLLRRIALRATLFRLFS
jgi:hypothetical protein